MEKRYDVFISCKSEDYSKAKPVFHWLVEKGHNPFFAPISLKVSKIQGEPVVFGDEVDDALEQADNMVLFASKAEYVRKGYVKDEWRTFVEEQRAGRKSGSLVTILDGVAVADLPIRLRSVQSFTPSNYKDGILRFLGDVVETDSQNAAHEEQQKTDDVFEHTKQEYPEKKLTFTVNGVSFDMIKVEGGTFQMGSNDSDAKDDEKPVHSVMVNSFYMGETEVTQVLWKAVMGSNPSFWKGDNLPVESVSWNDCQKFIRKLNQKTGRNFRLPTEAEWEYAARGGNQSNGYKYSGSSNIGSVAWYTDNSRGKTHAVKGKSPNELGLYDMSGNVWEWCDDWYGNYSSASQTNPKGDSSGSDRVLRGGSWFSFARGCRVSNRYFSDPDGRSNSNGFRLAFPQ